MTLSSYPLVPLSARRSVLLLVVLAAALTLAGWLLQVLALQASPFDFDPARFEGPLRWFDPGGTANIPTWYKAGLLLGASLLLFVIHAGRKRWEDPYTRYWRDLGLIFLAFSVNEVANLHRGLGHQLNALLDTRGPLLFAWVILASLFVLLVAAFYARFLASLETATRRRFLTAGALYVTGALLLKFLEGWYVSEHGEASVVYISIAAVRQLLQMAGILVFWYALLVIIREHADIDLVRIYP